MKTIAGYKFRIVIDNGDTDEWWREHHVESPLYCTRELAEKALLRYKKNELQKAKLDINKYISFQYKFEVGHGRSINKFLGDCQRSLMHSYKGVLEKIRMAEIVSVDVHSDVQDEVDVYDIAY